MASFNKVILCGHMTRDIEMRFTPKGTGIAQFGLAVNHTWKNEAGEKKEEVTFVDCVAWGKSGETLAQYTNKGSPLLVEGRLKLESWTDKESGGKRQKLMVVVENFQFLASANKDGNGAETGVASSRMRTSHMTRQFLFIGFAALFTGCASYNYNLAVKNVGTSEVWCSLIASSKGMAHEPGRLVPGAGKTIAGPFRVPYRDHWTVAWKTATGKEITRDLDLTQKIPAPFQGRLVFTIDDSQTLGYFTEPFQGR